MSGMFSDCTKLKFIDLSKFNTSSVKDMENMFLNCESLISLNLSNFDTSSVIIMQSMFGNCNQLIYLDLSNFNISNVNNTFQMFSFCISLNALNFKNLIQSSPLNIETQQMFSQTYQNLIYCIYNESRISQNLKTAFTNQNFKNNCSDICFINSKKIIINEKRCVIKFSKNKI